MRCARRPRPRRPPLLRGYRTALGRLLLELGRASDTGASLGLDADPVVVLAEWVCFGCCASRAASLRCVLRLEDVHWADDDTLALVEQPASAVAETPPYRLLGAGRRTGTRRPLAGRRARDGHSAPEAAR